MLSNYNKINKLIMWLVIGIITITIGLGINSNIASAKSSSQENIALERAENYIDYSGMSKKGLYNQLTSNYGDSFNSHSAKYAVNHLKVNWNKQAIKVAKNYQQFEHMSSHDLYEQLTSSYGDNFTPSQAKYAIKHL